MQKVNEMFMSGAKYTDRRNHDKVCRRLAKKQKELGYSEWNAQITKG